MTVHKTNDDRAALVNAARLGFFPVVPGKWRAVLLLHKSMPPGKIVIFDEKVPYNMRIAECNSCKL